MLPIVYCVTVPLNGHYWLATSFTSFGTAARMALARTNAVNAITSFEAESTRLELRLRACLEKSYFFHNVVMSHMHSVSFLAADNGLFMTARLLHALSTRSNNTPVWSVWMIH